MPEFFMHDYISTIIYREDRPYKIFETSHDSSFHYTGKKFFPDKFLFCSDNQLINFKDLSIPSCVIEYPIENPKINKSESFNTLKLEKDVKHVVNVGLFTPRKNQAEIFEYAKILKDFPIKFHFPLRTRKFSN